jgi:hypothetical protein
MVQRVPVAAPLPKRNDVHPILADRRARGKWSNVLKSYFWVAAWRRWYFVVEFKKWLEIG